MAETLEELTYDYEDEGVLVRKEIARVVLTKGSWATLMFLFQELDRAKGKFRAPKMAIVRFKKSKGSYRKQFQMPARCPVCGSNVVREEGEAASRCINLNCPGRLKESILHFASRGVMNIDGMGDALVDQLVDRQIVKNVADIYGLKIEDLVTLERIGVKSAGNVIRNIANSRNNPLPRVLTALGIRFVGERTAVFLAESFGTMDAIAAASLESGSESMPRTLPSGAVRSRIASVWPPPPTVPST